MEQTTEPIHDVVMKVAARNSRLWHLAYLDRDMTLCGRLVKFYGPRPDTRSVCEACWYQRDLAAQQPPK